MRVSKTGCFLCATAGRAQPWHTILTYSAHILKGPGSCWMMPRCAGASSPSKLDCRRGTRQSSGANNESQHQRLRVGIKIRPNFLLSARNDCWPPLQRVPAPESESVGIEFIHPAPEAVSDPRRGLLLRHSMPGGSAEMRLSTPQAAEFSVHPSNIPRFPWNPTRTTTERRDRVYELRTRDAINMMTV